ncbi:MAG: LacI family transcriptional regulator [Ramlibacter sp.]|jgi:tripartite-type tricarboxylate transporter receptor subunit TctC|nr:LacI family transcriptional regulator [Ramlibacter sp.]
MKLIRTAALLLAATFAATAQAAYPDKPIRIVVPYPPGGTTDLLTRLVAQKLSESIKQPVLVDNRAGGAAMIGSDLVAKSAPDGYTLLSTGAGPHVINVSLFPKIPYDPVRDFAPITLMSINPLLMVVPAAMPVNTAQEFIAWAREHKDKANYCSIGLGSPSHLAAELFKPLAGIEMTHIPYGGSGPAITATIGGVCSVLFDSVLSSGPHVKSGKLKVLATGNKQRLPSWPNVPTLAEAGLPTFEAFTWGALLAPAGTPHDVVARLQAEMARIFAMPDVRQKIEDMGALPGGGTSAELDAFTRSEIRKWAKVIKDGNIKPE